MPKIRPCLKCRHRRTDYHLTQLLTGQDSYKTYTKIIGNRATIHAVVHTFFECHIWDIERKTINRSVKGVLKRRNVVELMVSDESGWQKIHTYIGSVMRINEVNIMTYMNKN